MNKYIEALDTLIRFYHEKIEKLEAMKQEFVSVSSEDKSDSSPKIEHAYTYVDIASGRDVRKTIYEDGSVRIEYI